MERPQSSPLVELESVSKRFGKTLAVADLSLQIYPGEVFAFLGPNGAGKTTTIKMIVGLLSPTQGRATVCGHNVQRDGMESRRRLAYVPDQPFLYEKLSGNEFLDFVSKVYGMEAETARQRRRELVGRLRMEEYLGQLTESYSHGMKQKLVLAAALLHDPAVVVIDEPMVGLDPWAVRVVTGLLRAHAEAGNAVFMSTHTLGIAETAADRIGIIHRGRLVALGTLEQLRQQLHTVSGLEEIFLQLTEAPGGREQQWPG